MPELPFDIDKNSPIPVYYQLKEQLALFIRNETYPIGSQLPPETLIGEELGISRGTVRQAINALVAEGRLIRVQGSGTYVSEPTTALHLVQNFTSFAEDMIESNIPYSSRVLTAQIIPAKGRLLGKLGLEAGEGVIYLERLGAANDVPIVLAFSYLPEKLCPGLTKKDLTDQSLYALLEREYSLRLWRADRTLEAVKADDYESSLLQIPPGSPIHFLQSLTYLADGRPIEYSRLRFRGDRSRITFEVKRAR